MKLLWFSPLPPAKTDIANYTARIASHLRDLFDVTFVHGEGNNPAPGFGSISIASLSPRQINEADLCVYQIGNNPDFHSSIFETACEFPGLVVMHDRAIHELLLVHYSLVEEKTGIRQFEAYREAMATWYGAEGLENARLLELGKCGPAELAERFPLFEMALDRALGAVCHNPLLAGELRRRFPKLPIVDLPLPFAAPTTLPPRPRREPGRPIRLVMFGFMAANRRASEFLLSWSSSKYRDHFELHLAGELSDRSHFDAIATEHGLANRIHHHGFVEEAALDGLIRNADMALNLRNPTMGEASGSQLRIWANGCPSAVSDTGWYATLPTSCVRKIGTRAERADLNSLLGDLANGRLDLDRMAQRGFAQLREHDPARYARNLAAWIEANRGQMSVSWSESVLMKTVAGTYSSSLPAYLEPQLPPRLLG